MGFGSSVVELINNSKIENIKVKTFGYNDCFVEHGEVDELEEKNNLNSKKIINIIKGLQ